MSPALLSPESLRDRRDGGTRPRVIDVRTPAEFETAHIDGSQNVPLALLRQHATQIVEHLDGEVVLVCRSGARAQEASRILATSGLPNVSILDGGILAWQRVSTVNTGRPRWDIERQVRLVAGGLVFLAVMGGLLLPGLQYLGAAVGAGLAIAALTNTCAMGNLLSKLPYNRGAQCDLPTVVSRLRAGAGR